MSLHHPLLDRLAQTVGLVLKTEDDLDGWLAEPGNRVLFCGGNPVQYPECLDVAVVLPELLAIHRDRLQAAVLAPELEATAQARYGFNRWPSLVFLRDGAYLGTLSGMQDWIAYVARFCEILAAAPSRPPTVGIPVAAASSTSCH
ncbi:MAG: hydrogenase [Gallionellaceae bacterium]|nr:hydrogenase [Gallionellaceae bacterium]